LGAFTHGAPLVEVEEIRQEALPLLLLVISAAVGIMVAVSGVRPARIAPGLAILLLARRRL
jgi:hypothetical protein